MIKKRRNRDLSEQVNPFPNSKGGVRKVEIVEAAVRVIARSGIDRLTFESVGKEAKMGKSHVAYHFPDRDQIVQAAITYVYSVGQATVVEFVELEENPAEKLSAYIRGAYHWIESHPDHASVMALLLSLGSFNPEYRTQQTRIREIGANRIAAILAEMKGRKTKDQRAVAETIQSIVLGSILYWAAAETHLSLKELASRTHEMSLRMLK